MPSCKRSERYNSEPYGLGLLGRTISGIMSLLNGTHLPLHPTIPACAVALGRAQHCVASYCL
eukprot:841489-Amphidinium_carterae.1